MDDNLLKNQQTMAWLSTSSYILEAFRWPLRLLLQGEHPVCTPEEATERSAQGCVATADQTGGHCSCQSAGLTVSLRVCTLLCVPVFCWCMCVLWGCVCVSISILVFVVCESCVCVCVMNLCECIVCVVEWTLLCVYVCYDSLCLWLCVLFSVCPCAGVGSGSCVVRVHFCVCLCV